MDRFYREELYDDKGYRIRCIKSIIEQLKKDCSDLNGSKIRLKSEVLDISEIDKIWQKISWIKAGLRIFNKMKYRDIEGVISGNIQDMEKNAIEIENKLKMIKMTVSNETVVTHLR